MYLIKKIFRRLINDISHPVIALNREFRKHSSLIPNDSLYIKLVWILSNMGYSLNLKNPQTFSEKLQWLKLYDRRPEYTLMVDKVKVKEYVASILGDEYIIPTLGVWENPDDVDFDSLPEQFVIKCNHNSGGLYICKDKHKMDINEVKRRLLLGLKHNYYYWSREWPYKNVPRRIIAEKYIEPDSITNDLPDYKFFCFNGEPKYCQVITGRGKKMCIDFFDKDWNHQPFHEPRIYPFADETPKRPVNYEKMWNAAKLLAKNLVFSRIDFYDVGNHVYFGEITFFPTGGLGGFAPEEYDMKLGQMMILPKLA